MKRVMVAMSGGVDSSVAALLLKRQGYEVTGVTMCLGTEGEGGCCGQQAVRDARMVCDRLAIAHWVFDFASELAERVIAKFKQEYLRGRTPNPCIDCNRYLKFGTLLAKAKALGFHFLATGHYARIEEEGGTWYLKKPKDERKDQTYFLYAVPREELAQIIFPLAPYLKNEVREIAKEAGLPVHDKGESQDVCFVKKHNQEAIFGGQDLVRPGVICDEEGRWLGEHRGIAFYTIGQRSGLKISHDKPLYVLAIDAEKNRLIVGYKERLLKRGLIATDLNVLVDKWPAEVRAKIRYRKKEAPCRVERQGDSMRLTFDERQEAITPGQSVVCYHGDIILGGGVIERSTNGY